MIQSHWTCSFEKVSCGFEIAGTPSTAVKFSSFPWCTFFPFLGGRLCIKGLWNALSGPMCDFPVRTSTVHVDISGFEAVLAKP